MCLLRVELDDQLLADRHREVFTRRHPLDATFELLFVELEPLRHATAVDGTERLLDALDLARLLANRDDIARAHQVRRDVHLLAVHEKVTVTDELAPFGVVAREAETVDDVVHATLEQHEQVLARDALQTQRLVVVAAELTLRDAVD